MALEKSVSGYVYVFFILCYFTMEELSYELQSYSYKLLIAGVHNIRNFFWKKLIFTWID